MFLQLFRRFLSGGSSEGKAPTVTFVWGSPSSGVAERFCTEATCGYSFTLLVNDIDGDVTSIKIEISTDQGNTWGIFQESIPITTNNFSDNIQTGSKWYRAIVKDSEGHQVISSTLKMTKKLPALGNIVLVVDGIEYPPDGSVPVPIPVNTGNVQTFLRNKHPSQYVLFQNQAGTDPILLHKYTQPSNIIVPGLKPISGAKLLPGEQALVMFETGSNTGLYNLSESQVIGQLGEGNLHGTFTWTLNLGGGTIAPCRNYKVWAYVPGDRSLYIDWINCSGVRENIILTPNGIYSEYLDHIFCAQFGSVSTDIGTIEIIGECNP